MEAEEDDHGHEEMADDAPRKESVEFGMNRKILGFLHFKDADDP